MKVREYMVKAPLNIVAAVGLALGAIFGMVGSVVIAPNLRAISWAVDGTGLIVATVILALGYFRAGKDAVSSGFLIWAIGEAVMLGGTAGTLQTSVPSFAAGAALWSAALFLTCLPKEFAAWTRTAGIIGALLFAATSARIFWGNALTPLSRPLPFFAYPFLVITFAGWMWPLLKRQPAADKGRNFANQLELALR
jgi:hypothetical protein